MNLALRDEMDLQGAPVKRDLPEIPESQGLLEIPDHLDKEEREVYKALPVTMDVMELLDLEEQLVIIVYNCCCTQKEPEGRNRVRERARERGKEGKRDLGRGM